MAVGESPAVARRRLRIALRDAREAKRLTQRQVAEALEWSMSKVNRIESGEVLISGTDLQALLRFLDITNPDLVAELTAQGRLSRQRSWWNQYRGHLTPAMVDCFQFEADATEIRSFQPTLIPGLLQTEAYAKAMLAFWADKLPEDDLRTRIEVRTQRRNHMFSREHPPDYLVVLDESVLMREVGGPQVMSEQLYELLDFARSGRVRVRIVPLAKATGYSTYGLFTLYTIDDENVLLYVETYEWDRAVFKSTSIRHHRQLFEHMWEQSLSEEASIHAIEAQAATLLSAADRRSPSG
jgi:transcriptional regulator with XRE-family HTH domain